MFCQAGFVLSMKAPSRLLPRGQRLTCNDLLFVNAYLANGRNGTRAYQTVHPKTSYKVASVRASKVLDKVSVQQEIGQRVRHEGGITREFVESALLTHYHTAEEKGDYLAGASIAMDCAKVAGFLVERREVKQLTEEQSSSIRNLVRQSLQPLARESPQPVEAEKGV